MYLYFHCKQYILGSDKMRSIREPLVTLQLHANEEVVNLEMNPMELNNLINALDKVEMVLDK